MTRPLARGVDGLGKQLLASTGLAQHKHRHIEGRNPLRAVHLLPHRWAAVNDPRKLRRPKLLARQALDAVLAALEVLRKKVAREVEVEVDPFEASLGRSLDQPRREARLGEQDPDRYHCGRPGAQVEGGHHLRPRKPNQLELGTDFLVDLRVVDRAAQVDLVQIDIGVSRQRLEPVTVGLTALEAIVGQQEHTIEPLMCEQR